MKESSDRRFIEELLPLKEISLEGIRDKNIKQKNIGSLHIWWARRPIVVCRAAILGSLLSAGDQAKQKEISEFIKRFCKWEASTDLELVRKARQLIESERKKPKVLDCFGGGAAIPEEALRLGCEAYSLELNPVAILIQLCTVVYPQMYARPLELETRQTTVQGEMKSVITNRLTHDIEKWGNKVVKKAREEIGEYYPDDKDGSVPIAYVWARTLRCPNPECGAIVPLMKQLWLSKKTGKKVAFKMIPDSKAKKVKFAIVQEKNINFDPNEATIKLGSMRCPVCKEGTYNKTQIKKAARDQGLGQQPLAVVMHNDKRGYFYRLFDDHDFDSYEDAHKELEKLKKRSQGGLPVVPEERISTDYDWVLKPPMFGITKWGEMFNSRQALALVTFTRIVRESYDEILKETQDPAYAKVVATYLALILDSMAHYLSISATWLLDHMVSTFIQGQSIPFRWDYGESNPFGDRVGTWNYAMKQTIKTLEWLSGVPLAPADVKHGTATDMPYPNEFFDAVVTDPPYYDSVPYSDLSDFFYVWLKRSVGHLYPELFATPLAPKSQELVEQSDKVTSAANRIKTREFYETGVAKAFSEVHRVLKPDGICVVAFAHKTTEAWERLITSLLRAGLTVTASWPMHTERPARLRAHNSAALASSIWLVCRRRHIDAGTGSWKNVQAELENRVKERLDYFLSQGIRGADALLSAIGPALEVFGKYQKVEKVNGNPVTICEFLDKVREVVARHALSIVLSEHELGAVDPATAFYVLWKWTFEQSPIADETEDKSNGTKLFVHYDDALKLARAVGAELDLLITPYRLLQKEKDDVRLLGPLERKNITALGQIGKDGTHPFIIDMIHKAVILWSSQQHGLLDEYMKHSGAQDSTIFWRVAQALSNLLPLQSKEKQLLDGFLGRDVNSAFTMSKRNDYKTMDEFVEE